MRENNNQAINVTQPLPALPVSKVLTIRDYQSQFKKSLKRAISRSKLTHIEIATQMANLLGVRVTKTHLDNWTGEAKKRHRFPAEYLVAFCKVTGSYEPLLLICKLLDDEPLQNEIQKLDEEMEDLRKRREKRQSLLQIISDEKSEQGGRRTKSTIS